MPRLSDFITEHSQEILDAWETFAKALPAETPMDVRSLRDHAQAMLNVITADLETPESDEQRDRKARGLADDTGDGSMTAASKHGLGRAEHGISVENTVAEFRALRASVIELWVKQQQTAGPSELEDIGASTKQSIRQSPSHSRSSLEKSREHATVFSPYLATTSGRHSVQF